MLRRGIGYILRPHRVLAVFGALVSLVGGWQVVVLLKSHAIWTGLGALSTAELASFLGLFLIALLIARSLVSDCWSGVVQEKRVVCGGGQAGTPYDYRSLLLKDPLEVVFVAQNLRTLLSDIEFLPTVSQWLERNKARSPHLTVVLSTPSVLGALNPTARQHLKQSVTELKGFLSNDAVRDRTTVRFHPGASSLSAIVCDPKSKRRGILVFTPKWALDDQPANRLYCVIERWEHDDLFSLVAGTIPAMVQNDSLTLEQASQELGL